MGLVTIKKHCGGGVNCATKNSESAEKAQVMFSCTKGCTCDSKEVKIGNNDSNDLPYRHPERARLYSVCGALM